MKRIIFLLVGLIISVVSLLFALQGIKLEAVRDALAGVQPLFFVLMIVPYVLPFLTKVIRWQVMFHTDQSRVPFRLLFSALMISYIPLPFRAGEVARGAIASTRSGIPAPRVFSTILVEKVLDVLTLLLLLGISLPFISLPRTMQSTAVALGVVVLVPSLFLLALVLQPAMSDKLVRLVSSRMPARLGARVHAAATQALQGLAPLSRPGIGLQLALWSLAIWVINAVAIWMLLFAFNFRVSFVVALVLTIATNLSMGVPAAPGYIGTFELAVVAVMVALGLPKETSQTFAIMYHFIGLVPVAIIGVLALVSQGVGRAAFSREEAARLSGSATIETHSRRVVPVAPQDKR
ncbi:MAG: flippase-like domain-containing protein [Chloroflexota bacterium]|nr:flippase-like domain-containing protein [Chloroflexota bacterium]